MPEASAGPFIPIAGFQKCLERSLDPLLHSCLGFRKMSEVWLRPPYIFRDTQKHPEQALNPIHMGGYQKMSGVYSRPPLYIWGATKQWEFASISAKLTQRCPTYMFKEPKTVSTLQTLCLGSISTSKDVFIGYNTSNSSKIQLLS